MKQIKISIKSMQQMFHPCTDEYIKNVCHGRCCESSKGLKVVVSNNEIKNIEKLGATIIDNFIQPNKCGKCPFKDDDHKCKIHNDKPFGCKASPFILTAGDTLIVRNRYRLLICYKADGSLPVYLAHKWSLIQIFGVAEYNKLVQHMEKNNPNDLFLTLDDDKYRIFKENSKNRKNNKTNVLNEYF